MSSLDEADPPAEHGSGQTHEQSTGKFCTRHSFSGGAIWLGRHLGKVLRHRAKHESHSTVCLTTAKQQRAVRGEKRRRILK